MSDFMKCRWRIKSFDHGLYISALEHVMQFILSSCVLSVFINRINKHYNVFEVWIPEHGLYLRFGTGQCVNMECFNNIRMWPKVIAKKTPITYLIQSGMVWESTVQKDQTGLVMNTLLFEDATIVFFWKPCSSFYYKWPLTMKLLLFY